MLHLCQTRGNLHHQYSHPIVRGDSNQVERERQPQSTHHTTFAAAATSTSIAAIAIVAVASAATACVMPVTVTDTPALASTAMCATVTVAVITTAILASTITPTTLAATDDLALSAGPFLCIGGRSTELAIPQWSAKQSSRSSRGPCSPI